MFCWGRGLCILSYRDLTPPPTQFFGYAIINSILIHTKGDTFMSEALLGVVIGGLIASVSTFTNVIVSHRRWKFDKRLEYLKEKRNHLQQRVNLILKQLSEGMEKNDYDIAMLAEIEILLPKNIYESTSKFFEDEDQSLENMQKHLLYISREAKISIAEIDDEINKLIGLK